MIEQKYIREPEAKVPPECPHCSGSRYVLDVVETTFDEFEEVFYPCSMCCATGRKMTKVERTAIKAGR